tara:strand:- start:3810 stop:4232 length:423 start_codon:yes stop_codon:yes gene_type:complete
MDAFELAEDVIDNLHADPEEEEGWTETDFDAQAEHQESESLVPIKGVMTPYGMLPLTDDTLASRKFKFWVGHSNFRLTEDYYSIIGPTEGVETLDILTPYRFRIGVGKMFIDRTVMSRVRDNMVEHVKSQKRDPDENDLV